MLKDLAVETESRNIGVKRFENFLNRILPEIGLDNSEIFFEGLKSISAEELLSILERINGILTEVPIKNRDSFTSESGVQNEFFFNSAVELVPPPTEVRKRLLSETLSTLQQQLEGKLPDDIDDQGNLEDVREVIARTLFNLIIYLHPFGDGNGRTARTTYSCLSPEIANKSTGQLARRLTERPSSLREYHQMLNQSTLEMMLESRGIAWMVSDSPQLPMYDTDNPTRGLDADYLQFIAAYDVMTEEERTQYITTEEEHLVMKKDELPPELITKISSRINSVREEFVENILEFSVYPEKWPEWLKEPFAQAFNQTGMLKSNSEYTTSRHSSSQR